jgi:hypothetical protein
MAKKDPADKVLPRVKTETKIGRERQRALLDWMCAGQEVKRLEDMRRNGLPVAKATLRQAYALHEAMGDKLKGIPQ